MRAEKSPQIYRQLIYEKGFFSATSEARRASSTNCAVKTGQSRDMKEENKWRRYGEGKKLSRVVKNNDRRGPER